MERLFVYGTLVRGGVNQGLLGGARPLGAVRTVDGFGLVDLGPYPGMLAGGSNAVAGELYEVGAATLARLDRFEGHPVLFRRTEVRLAGGGTAFAYLIDPAAAAGRPAIPAGTDGAARWVQSLSS